MKTGQISYYNQMKVVRLLEQVNDLQMWEVTSNVSKIQAEAFINENFHITVDETKYLPIDFLDEIFWQLGQNGTSSHDLELDVKATLFRKLHPALLIHNECNIVDSPENTRDMIYLNERNEVDVFSRWFNAFTVVDIVFIGCELSDMCVQKFFDGERPICYDISPEENVFIPLQSDEKIKEDKPTNNGKIAWIKGQFYRKFNLGKY